MSAHCRRPRRDLLARPEALPLAPRPARPAAPVHGPRPRRAHRPRRLLVVGADLPVRDHARARHADRQGRGEPAGLGDEVPRGGPLLPLVHLPVPAAAVRVADLGLRRVGERRPQPRRGARPGLHRRHRLRHRHQHRARARPQAQGGGALAVEGRARPDGLRPLLHRAQPRPPRPRGDAGGPRQLAPRRGLLALPAAHRQRLARLGLGARARALRARGRALLVAPQRHPQRVGDDRRAVRRADRRLRLGRPPVPAAAGRVRLPAAGGRQLPRALRAAAPEARGRALRAHASRGTRGTPTTSSSNVLLYHLQRHSDHHANPMRRYQSLRHFDEAPELPAGTRR